MDCTQKLDFSECSQKIETEVIGYLGINGRTYPVHMGPNKIGRDPSLCDIVIDLNSLSRQHAVINIVNKTNFMIMDLKSRNRSKVGTRTLQPYIPQTLKNGDMVQFGDIFGVFSLDIGSDDELPATQDVDIPDTPLYHKTSRRVNQEITTVSESPDVSDKRTLQPYIPQTLKNGDMVQFGDIFGVFSLDIGSDDELPATQDVDIPDTPLYHKTSRRVNQEITTVSESPDVSDKDDSFVLNSQPVMGPPTRPPIRRNNNSQHNDSLFWTASERSPSIKFSLEDSDGSCDTSIENKENISTDIFDAVTQIPDAKNIHEDETQVPSEETISNNIHSLETQLEDVRAKCIEPINEMPTQLPEQDVAAMNSGSKEMEVRNEKVDHSSESDEEIMFDEFDTQCLDSKGESQMIVDSNHLNLVENNDCKVDDYNCFTDCEDDVNNTKKNDADDKKVIVDSDDVMKPECNINHYADDEETDCEDMIDSPEPDSDTKKSDNNKVCVDRCNIDEMLTQVIDLPSVANQDTVPNVEANVSDNNNNGELESKVDFDDLLTQVLPTELPKETKVEMDIEDLPTQIIPSDSVDIATQLIENESSTLNSSNGIILKMEEASPFKLPMTPKKIGSSNKSRCSDSPKKVLRLTENYYDCTQELISDLESQNEDDDIIPSSQEDNDIGDPLPGLSKEIKMLECSSSSDSGMEEAYISSKTISTQDIRDLIGFSPTKKRICNDSDSEMTPVKKKNLLDIELPDSQEICISLNNTRHSFIMESSESDFDDHTPEEQLTPLLIVKKPKRKKEAAKKLLEILEPNKLPTRIISRVRKPTQKALESEVSDKLLKSCFIESKEDDINYDLVYENIAKIKKENKPSLKPVVSPPKSSQRKSSPVSNAVQQYSEEIVKILQLTPNVKIEEKTKYKVVKKRSKTKENKEAKIKKENSSPKEVRQTRSRKKSESNGKSDKVKSGRPPKSDMKPQKEKVEPIVIIKEMKTDVNEKIVDSKPITHTAAVVTRVRRSTRNKSSSDEMRKDESKKKKETESKKTRRRKKSPEVVLAKCDSTSNESVVFSSPDNRSRKRNADNMSVGTPKRCRTTPVDSPLRSTSRISVVNKKCILYTAFTDEKAKKMLQKLGAVTVNDALSCSLVVTSSIKRTVKLLCAVGLGKPIVGESWLKACRDTNMFVDPWLYLLKDLDTEKRFNFSLSRTLTGARNFLSGYNVSSTPSVLPTPGEMKLIVECSGGVWREGGKSWLCVSCNQDWSLWPKLRSRGAVIVTSELILSGVLTQRLDLNSPRTQDWIAVSTPVQIELLSMQNKWNEGD